MLYLSDEVDFNTTGRTDEDKKSINRCRKGTFKIANYYFSGQDVVFDEIVAYDNAQSLIERNRRKESKFSRTYFKNRLAIFLIFFILGFISIGSWVFNIYCWKKSRCRICPFFQERTPNLRRFVWWTCLVLLLGIFLCCRFGFEWCAKLGHALNSVQCGYERIIYDTQHGLLKHKKPFWTGLENNFNTVEEVKSFSKSATTTKAPEFFATKNYTLDIGKLFDHNDNNEFDLLQKFTDNFDYKLKTEFKINLFDIANNMLNINRSQPEVIIEKFENFFDINDIFNANTYYGKFLTEVNKQLYTFMAKYERVQKSYEEIAKLHDAIDDLNYQDIRLEFKQMYDSFAKDFVYQVKVDRAMGFVVAILFFSILMLTVVVNFGGLMFYICTKTKQKKLQLPMFYSWNVMRFCVFMFFMYATYYGMIYRWWEDQIGYIKFVFSEENYNATAKGYNMINIPAKSKYLPSFLHYCQQNTEQNYFNKINSLLKDNLEIFFTESNELREAIGKKPLSIKDAANELSSKAHCSKEQIPSCLGIKKIIDDFNEKHPKNEYIVYSAERKINCCYISKVQKLIRSTQRASGKFLFRDLYANEKSCNEFKDGTEPVCLDLFNMDYESLNNIQCMFYKTLGKCDHIDTDMSGYKYQEDTLNDPLIKYIKFSKFIDESTIEIQDSVLVIDNMNKEINESLTGEGSLNKEIYLGFPNLLEESKTGIFNTLTCGFIKNNINILQTAIYDLSLTFQDLFAIAVCTALFSEIFIPFYLWMMNIYEYEVQALEDEDEGLRKGRKKKKIEMNERHKKKGSLLEDQQNSDSPKEKKKKKRSRSIDKSDGEVRRKKKRKHPLDEGLEGSALKKKSRKEVKTDDEGEGGLRREKKKMDYGFDSD